MSGTLDFRARLGERLGDVIGERTLAEFAAEVGVSQSSLSRWLNGDAVPSRRLAHRIVRRYPALGGVLLEVRPLREEAAAS
jgi:transcriptional regulator with XRE-family HTH domain